MQVSLEQNTYVGCISLVPCLLANDSDGKPGFFTKDPNTYYSSTRVDSYSSDSKLPEKICEECRLSNRPNSK